MKDRRALVVLVVLVAIVVGGGIWSQSRHSSAVKINPNPDPLVTTTTTVVTSTTASTIKASDVDWNAALKRVIDGENQLFANPDPSKVSDIMLPTCSCFADTQQRVSNLKQNGWHVAGPVQNIGKSSFVVGSSTSITVAMTPTLGGNPTVDATGKTVEAAPKGTVLPLVYVLDKGRTANGAWLTGIN